MSIRRLSRLAALVVAVLLAPSALHAQFGGMGGMGGMGRGGMGRGGMGGRGGGAGGPSARRSDPLINTVDLILKHGTELALRDSQVIGLQRVKTHQDSAISGIKQRLDSLGQERRDAEDGGDPLAGQGRQQARGELMLAYREVLKQNRDTAFALLDKKQRKEAGKFEDALKKEMESSEPAEQSGVRGMGGRRGGRPGI
jgi:hypothetical protein